jgi:hypothetical protein
VLSIVESKRTARGWGNLSTTGRRAEAGTDLSQTKQSVDTVIDYSGKAYRHFSPLATTVSGCPASLVHRSLLRID